MNNQRHYILVDDDPYNNLICEVIIKKTDPGATVENFEDPEEALLVILEKYSDAIKPLMVTLFLDINMPQMDGWEFLNSFRKFTVELQGQFKIYILSSSALNSSDTINRYPFLSGVIQKPLTEDKMQEVAAGAGKFQKKASTLN